MIHKKYLIIILLQLSALVLVIMFYYKTNAKTIDSFTDEEINKFTDAELNIIPSSQPLYIDASLNPLVNSKYVNTVKENDRKSSAEKYADTANDESDKRDDLKLKLTTQKQKDMCTLQSTLTNVKTFCPFTGKCTNAGETCEKPDTSVNPADAKINAYVNKDYLNRPPDKYDPVYPFNIDALYNTDKITQNYDFIRSSYVYSTTPDDNGRAFFDRAPEEMKTLCANIDKNVCGYTKSCIYFGGDTCVPGNENGPFTEYQDLNKKTFMYRGKPYPK